MANQQNYYTNPAFCQQSEFYTSRRRALSPERRQPPVGAHKPLQSKDYYEEIPPKIGPKPAQRKHTNSYVPNHEYGFEEMLVDDGGQLDAVNGNERGPEATGGRRELSPGARTSKHRYEYIPMQEHELPARAKRDVQPHRVHRYAVIPGDEEPEQKPTRYALVPVEDLENSRYLEMNRNRYEYIQDECYEERKIERVVQNVSPKRVLSPQTPRKANPVATQKLHELLATPKKTPQKILSPQSQRRNMSPGPPVMYSTPNKPQPMQGHRMQTPRAQKNLNYALSTRTHVDKRHTAVIAPICSSPVQSVYSETTFSNKTASWMNVSLQKPPVQATLAVAAIMMILCGGLTSGLCFYMVSVVGRMYYLDFGIVSGFACLLLGLLGFRSRNCQWLPNRNYISGYIVLSAFSLLTCAGLLVLLFLQPKPGSPLADVTSGAVCGISGLSLVLASAGVIASYCCKYPPPDNRVQHCARGFTV